MSSRNMKQQAINIRDAPRPGPPKQSDKNKKTIEAIVQDEPTLTLREIADTASQFNIQAFKDTMDKALKETDFSLKVRRRKLYFMLERKERRPLWCDR